jgi:ABC-2 type transport system ATP-binding protein
MINIINLHKSYKTKSGTNHALNNVSLDVKIGEILGILGLNGAGKSTLVNIIAGIVKPDSGEIRINNLTPDCGKKYREQFSVVYQNTGLDFYMSVYDNLKVNGIIYGFRGSELTDRIDKVIEMMGLQKYARSKINELSGGYRKRVQVAKTLMLNTKVILFDEPTQGMDPFIKRVLFDEILNRKKENCSIIYTTQIIDEIEQICDRVLILQKGSVISHDNIINTKNRFSDTLALRITHSGTVPNSETLSSLIYDLYEAKGLKIRALYFTETGMSIVSDAKMDALTTIYGELKDYIKIEEFSIIKPSLEQILLNMEEGTNYA